ncbi:MAG: hypothetical protein OEM89_04965 [Nitrosopumilus sp.]|nr:hypothetical protein [Nitrosopumilus sp.]
MSTIQVIYKTETRQPEPAKILVESIPVEEGRKLSRHNEIPKSIPDCTWEDLRGLSLGLEEEWV